MITIETLLFIGFSGWGIAVLAIFCMLFDQYCYDRRIKELEKEYEKQVHVSVTKCRRKIELDAYQEGIDDIIDRLGDDPEFRDKAIIERDLEYSNQKKREFLDKKEAR